MRAGPKPFLLLPIAGLIVAGLAITFAQLGDQTPYAVLFSGSRALVPVVQQAETLSVATLGLLYACKGLAWAVSMGSFRGGPVFPAIFVGTVGDLLASHLPGFPEGAAIAAVMAATIVAALRLPLAAVVIALLLTSSAGAAVTPLISSLQRWSRTSSSKCSIPPSHHQRPRSGPLPTARSPDSVWLARRVWGCAAAAGPGPYIRQPAAVWAA